MRKILVLLLSFLLSQPVEAAPYVPTIDGPFYPVKSKSGSGSFAIGCGVIYTGNALSGGIEIDAPAAGGQVDLVVVVASTSESVVTKAVLVWNGLVQLRAGATVAKDDMVKIVDTQGRWGPGDAMAANTYYRALQAGSTGNLFWARPGGREGIRMAQTSTPLTGTGAAQNIPHGLGATPTACKAYMVEIPAANVMAAVGVTAGVHDSTHAKFTATSGVKYHVTCWL